MSGELNQQKYLNVTWLQLENVSSSVNAIDVDLYQCLLNNEYNNSHDVMLKHNFIRHNLLISELID